MSAVAQRNAPPQNAAPGAAGAAVWVAVTVLGLMAGGGLLWPLGIGFVLGMATAIWVGKTTQADFAVRQAAYARQWYCRQCGSMFSV